MSNNSTTKASTDGIMTKIKNNDKVFAIGSVDITYHTVIAAAASSIITALVMKPKGK